LFLNQNSHNTWYKIPGPTITARNKIRGVIGQWEGIQPRLTAGT